MISMSDQRINPNKVLLLVYRVLDGNVVELLLLKTTPEPWCDSVWYVITGGIEAGETVEIAAERELFEETGMKDIKRVTTKSVFYIYKDQRSNKKAIEQLVLVEVGGSDEITLDKEHTEYKWVGKEEFVEEIDWFGHKEKLKRLLMDLLS